MGARNGFSNKAAIIGAVRLQVSVKRASTVIQCNDLTLSVFPNIIMQVVITLTTSLWFR